MFNPTWLYVGAVYAVAVAMARRAGVALPKRIAGFFYALVLVFMYLPLTQDFVNVEVDFALLLPPWMYVTRAKVINTQMNDVALQIVPWAHQVRESWKSLTPPLWNHLSACGYPLLANPQSSALSPLRILGLPLSLGHAMTFEASMKILIALTFMFLWCRRRGHSEIASAAGAVAFGFSTFLVVWLHFPLATTACLVPAVFYFIDLLAERVTFARFAGGALVWTCMLFGGHPETVSHAFFMAALYVAWVAFVEKRISTRRAVRNFLGTLIAAIGVAGLLAMPLLMPFAEMVTKSKRFHELKASSGEPGVPFSDWTSGKLLVQPQFFGEMPHEGWGPAHAESISGFAGTLGIAAWFAMAAHVIRRRAWRSVECFFVIVTLFALGIVLSWPGIAQFFHFFFQLAANARVRLFLVLFLAMQTASAIDLFDRDRKALLSGITCTAALFVVTFATTHFALEHHRAVALQSLLPGVAILLLALIGTFATRHRHIVMLLLVAAIAGELFKVGRDWNPAVPNDAVYPKTPLLLALDREAAKTKEPFRIVAGGPAYFPNVSAIYGYEDIRAHDPMANSRYIRLLSLVIDYDAANYFAEWNVWERRLVDYLNVRYVIATPDTTLPPRFAVRYDGPDGRLFENTEVLPRFYASRNVILEFRDGPFDQNLKATEDWANTAFLENLTIEAEPQQRNDFFKPRPANAPIAATSIREVMPTDFRVHANAPRWTLIASSLPWWPGWKVERDGNRIEPVRVNSAFLGFSIPPGSHDVRVWYSPTSFWAGVWISLLTVIGLIAFRKRLSGTFYSAAPGPPNPPA